jgi:hypothetical protein
MSFNSCYRINDYLLCQCYSPPSSFFFGDIALPIP